MQSKNNENINKHTIPVQKVQKQLNRISEADTVFTDEEVKAASKRAMAKYRDAYVELAKYDSN